jgi:hypothetical protein
MENLFRLLKKALADVEGKRTKPRLETQFYGGAFTPIHSTF